MCRCSAAAAQSRPRRRSNPRQRRQAAGLRAVPAGQVDRRSLQALGRARSTVTEYLADFIASHGISDPSAWIDETLFARIRPPQQHGLDRLKPLYEALGGEVSYDELRIAVACLRNAPP